MSKQSKIVLILGSGPNAVESEQWDLAQFSAVVAINNAWKVRPGWSHVIYPDDFPLERRPASFDQGQTQVTSGSYVPVQNAFGGFVYAGGTMAFTAGYWALGALAPTHLAFIGCDMVYPKRGPTHFYGTGEPDPLRADITLQNLEAKSARLMAVAATRGCVCINLSSDESRLVFPRSMPSALETVDLPAIDAALVSKALAEEQRLGYFVESGKYWEAEDQFDPRKLAALDQIWRDASSTESKT